MVLSLVQRGSNKNRVEPNLEPNPNTEKPVVWGHMGPCFPAHRLTLRLEWLWWLVLWLSSNTDSSAICHLSLILDVHPTLEAISYILKWYSMIDNRNWTSPIHYTEWSQLTCQLHPIVASISRCRSKNRSSIRSSFFLLQTRQIRRIELDPFNPRLSTRQ